MVERRCELPYLAFDLQTLLERGIQNSKKNCGRFECRGEGEE